MNLPHQVIVKAPGLLPMLYKVSELASDLEIPERTLRDWLDTGAPHHRDEKSHLWVNGQMFAKWVQENRKQKRPASLADHQAYCLRCKKVVELIEPQVIHIKGKLINIQGSCPDCSCTINRGGRDGKAG